MVSSTVNVLDNSTGARGVLVSFDAAASLNNMCSNTFQWKEGNGQALSFEGACCESRRACWEEDWLTEVFDCDCSGCGK